MYRLSCKPQASPLAALIVVFCSVVMLMGVKESVRFNTSVTGDAGPPFSCDRKLGCHHAV